MSKEAMKLALEALNKLTDAAGGFSVSGVYFNEGVWEQECLNSAYDAIKALEEALAKQEHFDLNEDLKAWQKDGSPIPAKQEQGEPVAKVVPYGATVKLEWYSVDAAHNAKIGPLYTTPQQRKPLTDEQIEMIWTVDQTSADDCASLYYAKVIARAIEAAHGIKE